MNIKEISTDKARLLFVKVPEDASDLVLPKIGIADIYFHLNSGEYGSIGIPPGSWSDPVRVEEVTEGMASQILPSKPFYPDYFNGETTEILFPDFEDDMCYKAVDAIDSFQSLLEANEIYTVNPLGERPVVKTNDMFLEYGNIRDQEKWDSLQENTASWLMLIEKI